MWEIYVAVLSINRTFFWRYLLPRKLTWNLNPPPFEKEKSSKQTTSIFEFKMLVFRSVYQIITHDVTLLGTVKKTYPLKPYPQPVVIPGMGVTWTGPGHRARRMP